MCPAAYKKKNKINQHNLQKKKCYFNTVVRAHQKGKVQALHMKSSKIITLRHPT